MRKWLSLVLVSMLALTLLGTSGCVKSKLPTAPTVAVTGTVSSAYVTPTATSGAGIGKTVVAAEATPTTGGVSGTPTPIPTMTPTTAPGSPTNTPQPTATSAPGGATATPIPPTGSGEFTYTVQAGDTLWGIAIRFGTTVEAIMQRNGLTSHIIYRGQKLVIPGASSGGTVTHIVQPGENLFRISLKYGTTVEAIAAANGIVNPHVVYAGQKLLIPKGNSGATPPIACGRYHVVQPGETLWSIAMRYGTTPWKIAAANGISNINWIYAGQTLCIP